MNYFDNEKNVADYIKMADGTDGRELIPVLRQHLPDGSSLLELGMGPGVDLDLLSEHYRVTGSDSSSIFIEHYRNSHPDADLLLLDAAKIDTTRAFDGIYSNKVLIHLTKDDVRRSFQRQAEVLNPGGIAFHTFWYGVGEEEVHGLRFVYYAPETLGELIGNTFDTLEMKRYRESTKDDSFYIILKKR